MIEIGIVIGGGVAFYKFAKEHGLLAWFWAIVPALAYFGGAFILGIIIALVAPDILEDQLLLTVIALFGGAAFVGIAYLIMRLVASKKVAQAEDSTLLDTDLSDTGDLI